MKEGFMDIRPSLIAHRKPAIPAKPRQCSLHYPPVPPQSLAGFDAPPSDAWGYASLPEGRPAALEVIALG
jgi:hypothetical protein